MIAVDTTRIEELERARAAAPGELVAAEERLEKAKADHEAARSAFQAARARAEIGHVPQSAVAQSERALKSARTELDAAEDAAAIATEKAKVLIKALVAERKKIRDEAAPRFRAEGARFAREIQQHLDALVSLGESARGLEGSLHDHMTIQTTATGGRLFQKEVEPVAAALAFLRSPELKSLLRRWSIAPGAAALASE
jgi:hypothetical protein